MIKRLSLTTGSLNTSPVDPVMQRDYLGGLGLAARLMADIADVDLPPLDPAMPLIVSVGSLSGTGFPGANRTCFFGLSPLTGVFAGSWLGGNFGMGFVRSGTLALVLEGKAADPSVVIVRERDAEVVPRPDLWGLTVLETRTTLERDYGTMRAVIIGPAGERLVKIANIRGDEGHVAGRCGMGAILGSKNVKAILVSGKAKPPVADPDGLRAINRDVMQAIRKSSFLTDVQGPIGTPSLTQMVNEFHASPTGNFQERYFEMAPMLYGDRIAEEYVYKRTTCPNCPVRCRSHVRIDGEDMEGAEYETICLFGNNNRVDDYPLIARANALCNDLGLDTISAGNVVAFYREYAGTMNDPSNILDVVRRIAFREGDGDILAEGVRRAAASFRVDYGMHVKGLELAARYHDDGCIRDSLIVCTFLCGDISPFFAPALTSVLGDDYDEERMALIGDRIYTLERSLNVRRGVDVSADVLPVRIMEGLVDRDKYLEGMKAYYRIRGWNADGHPTAEKLDALNLGFMA